MANTIGQLLIELRANTTAFAKGMQEAKETSERTSRDVSTALRGIGTSLEDTGKKAEQTAKVVTGHFNGIGEAGKRLTEILGVLAGAFALHELTNTISKLQNAQLALAAAAGGAEKGAAEYAFLGEAARKLGLEHNSLASAYAKLEIATRGTALEGQRTRDMFLGIATAAKGMGGDTAAVNELMNVFTRSLSRVGDGTVQIGMLRRVLAEIPGGMNMLAQATGKTVTQLQEMSQTMALRAQPALYALSQVMRQNFAAGADAAADSIDSWRARVTNAFDEVAGAIGKSGFAAGITQALKTITEALESGDVQKFAASIGSGLAEAAKLATEAMAFLGRNVWLIKAAFEAWIALKIGSWIAGTVSAVADLTKVLRGLLITQEAVNAATAANSIANGAKAASGLASAAATAASALQKEAAAQGELFAGLGKAANAATGQLALFSTEIGTVASESTAATSAITAPWIAVGVAAAAAQAAVTYWQYRTITAVREVNGQKFTLWDEVPLATGIAGESIGGLWRTIKQDAQDTSAFLRKTILGMVEPFREMVALAEPYIDQLKSYVEQKFGGISDVLAGALAAQHAGLLNTQANPAAVLGVRTTPAVPAFAYQSTPERAAAGLGDMFAPKPGTAARELEKMLDQMNRLIEKSQQLVDKTEGDKLQAQYDKLAATIRELDDFRERHPERVWANINAAVNQLNDALNSTVAKQAIIRNQLAAGIVPGLKPETRPIESVLNAPVGAPAATGEVQRQAELIHLQDDVNERNRLAVSIYDETRTASERYAHELTVLNVLKEKDSITQDEYNRRMKQFNTAMSEAFDPTVAYEKEIARLNDLLKANQDLQQHGKPPMLTDAAEENIRKQIRELEAQKAATDGGIGAGMNAGLITFADQWRGVGREMMDTTMTALSGMQEAFSRFFSDVLTGTKSLGQAFAEFGRNMLASVVNALAQMLAKWIATHIAMAIVSKLFGVSDDGADKAAKQIAANMAIAQSDAGVAAANTLALTSAMYPPPTPEALAAATYGVGLAFAGLTAMATGGVMGQNFDQSLLAGGIANRSTLVEVGEGTMPEAVIPMPNRRSVGIVLDGNLNPVIPLPNGRLIPAHIQQHFADGGVANSSTIANHIRHYAAGGVVDRSAVAHFATGGIVNHHDVSSVGNTISSALAHYAAGGITHGGNSANHLAQHFATGGIVSHTAGDDIASTVAHYATGGVATHRGNLASTLIQHFAQGGVAHNATSSSSFGDRASMAIAHYVTGGVTHAGDLTASPSLVQQFTAGGIAKASQTAMQHFAAGGIAHNNAGDRISSTVADYAAGGVTGDHLTNTTLAQHFAQGGIANASQLVRHYAVGGITGLSPAIMSARFASGGIAGAPSLASTMQHFATGGTVNHALAQRFATGGAIGGPSFSSTMQHFAQHFAAGGMIGAAPVLHFASGGMLSPEALNVVTAAPNISLPGSVTNVRLPESVMRSSATTTATAPALGGDHILNLGGITINGATDAEAVASKVTNRVKMLLKTAGVMKQ